MKTIEKRAPVILFEGPDLVGKGSLIKNILPYCINTVLLKEPTGYIGSIYGYDDKICKDFLMTSSKKSNLDLIRYYMAMASRVSVYSNILDNILDGKMVLLDRSFPSTMVYQKMVNRDIYKENIDLIKDIMPDIMVPDMIIFLDIIDESLLIRIKNSKRAKDDIDNSNSLDVNKEYKQVQSFLKFTDEFKNKTYLLNANNSEMEMKEQCLELIKDFLTNFKLGNGSKWLKEN